jgi:hypothetical protein
LYTAQKQFQQEKTFNVLNRKECLTEKTIDITLPETIFGRKIAAMQCVA